MASAIGNKPVKVAYMMSRFPKITETFVLYEILAVMKQNIPIEVYPLMRERTNVMHAEAIPLVEAAHFTPHFSFGILAANIRAILKQPYTYIRTLWTSARATLGSRRFFVGTLALFPKSVYLAELMQVAGITHLHAHFASFPAASAYIIHQLTGMPYSFTAHGSDLHRDKHMLCEKVRDANFVVAISQYNKRAILDYCDSSDEAKVYIIHCGVDTEIFKPAETRSLDGPVSIVCTGTLHEVKGQMYLLQACARLKERAMPFACHLIGDGPDEQKLREQISSLNLGKEVVLHGRLQRNDVLAVLSKADIVVAPSVPSRDGRREGIPVALMEGMAFGIPVVASDLSGIPELVTNNCNGFLVAPRDVDGLAEALAKLMTDPDLRRKLGMAGQSRIINDFNQEENARILSRLFRETPP